MPSIAEELAKRNFNPDGTLKLEHREELCSRGWDENEINQLEQRHIRNAAIDREQAEWQKELARQRAESNAQYEEKRRQQAESQRIPYKPLPFSNGSNLSRQTRAEAMAGLDPEELINQGFLEVDDYYDPRDESTISPRSKSKAEKSEASHDPNWEPEGGWIDF